MSDNSKASQRPWTAEGPDEFGDYNLHVDDVRLAVAAVVSNLREPEVVTANAALIIRAVNAHDDLVEALETCASLLQSAAANGKGLSEHASFIVNREEQGRQIVHVHDALDAANAVLAKIRGASDD